MSAILSVMSNKAFFLAELWNTISFVPCNSRVDGSGVRCGQEAGCKPRSQTACRWRELKSTQNQNQRQLRTRGADIGVKSPVINVAPQGESKWEMLRRRRKPAIPRCEHRDLICITGSLLWMHVLGQIHSIKSILAHFSSIYFQYYASPTLTLSS